MCTTGASSPLPRVTNWLPSSSCSFFAELLVEAELAAGDPVPDVLGLCAAGEA